MTKLYCYVDESGIGSNLFSVAAVIVGDGRDDLSDTCQQIERTTGKGIAKWRRASHDKRIAYLKAVVSDDRFKGALCFAMFEGIKDFDTATVSAIIRAIEHIDPEGLHRVSVFIDGLNDKKQREYASQIKGRVSSFVNVRGVARDESSPLIRLADAVAGFVRDVNGEESEDVVALFERAQRLGAIVQV